MRRRKNFRTAGLVLTKFDHHRGDVVIASREIGIANDFGTSVIGGIAGLDRFQDEAVIENVRDSIGAQ